MRTIEPIDRQTQRELLRDASNPTRENASIHENDSFLPRPMFARELMGMPGGWSLAELREDFLDEPYFDNLRDWTAQVRSRKVQR